MAKGKIYLVALMLVAAAMPVLGSTISTQIREGVYKEEVEGDLDAAIKIYEGIITAHADNQRYAAQATYRLGLCYLKKGQNDKAIEQFERIVKDYPTEKTTGRKAEQQLKKLKPTDNTASSEPASPVVIDSFPKTYSNDISADVDKLTVTFDQPMIKGNYSWVKWNYTFPETTGKPYYDEKGTTCTLPVKLEPGTAYLIRINAKQYSSFMNLDGVRAQPFVLVFATKDKDGKPTPIPEEMLKFAKYINGQQIQTNNATSKKSLKLIDAPWVDREKTVLELKTPAGMEIGNITFTAKAEKREVNDFWVIESYMIIPIQKMQQYTRVEAEVGTYKPVYGRTKNWLGDFAADYSDGKVVLNTDSNGNKTTTKFEFDIPVYDNEEALFMIRSMPLSVGFEQSFDLFPVQGASVIKCTINVTGKEKVKVKAGEFDCFKVNLACTFGKIKALEHKLWFSADKHQYLVKYDSGTAVMELSEIGLIEKGPQVITDSAFGYSFRLPAGWTDTEISSSEQYKVSRQLISPQMSSFSVLTANENIDSKETIRSAAKEDMELLKGVLKDYTLRKDSWVDRRINKLDASTFIADYEDKGKPMVEYRAYIKSPAMVYWFVFRVEKNKFDESKPQYDSIINSFKVDASAVSSNKAKAEQLAAEGWKLWGQRKLAEAEAKFKEAIDKDAGCENAYQGLGWAQLNQGKKVNAKDSFAKCIKLNADNSAALNGLGWIAHGDGKTDEAVQWWEKAVKAQPGATASLNGLTQVYMERKEYEKAVLYYKMWLKVEPLNKEAKIGLLDAERLLSMQQELESVKKMDKRSKQPQRVIEKLIAELHNPQAQRFEALNSLIDIGDSAVEPLIKELDKSNNWQVAKALGAIKDKRAVGPLIKKWEKANQSPINDVIAEALGIITGKEFGKDLKAWKDWYALNGK